MGHALFLFMATSQSNVAASNRPLVCLTINNKNGCIEENKLFTKLYEHLKDNFGEKNHMNILKTIFERKG